MRRSGHWPATTRSLNLSRRWKRSSLSKSATGYSQLSKSWFFGRTPRTKRCSNRRGREIWQSWRRACAEHAAHPRAAEIFDRHTLPAFHDPFAGGGALPLEAQRLGLEAHASDLNPVAVLINKAMIEIPPKFAGRPPVNPAWSEPEKRGTDRSPNGRGAQGLAEDVRYYGQWMRERSREAHRAPVSKGRGFRGDDRRSGLTWNATRAASWR